MTKPIADMTNEQLLDRIEELIAWADDRERFQLMKELRDRLNRQISATVSFKLNGSPESIGVTLAEIIAGNASPEEIREAHSQLLSEISRNARAL